MTKLSLIPRELLADESGPTAVEYAVMLALIVLICFGAILSVGSGTNRLFTQANSSITAAQGGS